MSLGFYFNADNCIGCRACQVACKDLFDLNLGGPRPRRVDTYEAGSYPNPRMYHLSVSCNHCDNPACVASCPTGAVFKDAETGVVLHDAETCIACQTCVEACPYGAPQYDAVLNRVVKCDACQAMREQGANPACVDACPARALEFGDVEELVAKYGPELVSEATPLPAADVTGPNLVMKPKGDVMVQECRLVLM